MRLKREAVDRLHVLYLAGVNSAAFVSQENANAVAARISHLRKRQYSSGINAR
jgi:hypothetical protein